MIRIEGFPGRLNMSFSSGFEFMPHGTWSRGESEAGILANRGQRMQYIVSQRLPNWPTIWP